MKIFNPLLILAFLTTSNLAGQTNCSLPCRDHVIANVEEDGTLQVQKTDILENIDPNCLDSIKLILKTTSGSDVIHDYTDVLNLDCSDLGDFFRIQATYFKFGNPENSCWGYLSVLDGNDVCDFILEPDEVSVSIGAGFTGPFVSNVLLNGIPIKRLTSHKFAFKTGDLLLGLNKITFNSYSSGSRGVTTLDMVLTKKILFEESVENEISTIAADMSQGNYVKVADIHKMVRIVLGIDPTNQFYFIHPNQSFPNFSPFDFGENVYEFTFLDTDVPALTFDFQVYQHGDLNQSINFRETHSDPRSAPLFLQLVNVRLNEGEEYSINMTADEARHFYGFQAGLKLTDAEIINIETGYSNLEFLANAAGDALKLSFLPGETTTEFQATLRIRALKDGYLSDFIALDNDFHREAVNTDLTTRSVDLVFNSPTETTDENFSSDVFRMFWNGQSLNIEHVGLSDGRGSVSVMDMLGRIIHEQAISGTFSSLSLQTSTPGGVYLVCLQDGVRKCTQKIFIP